MHLRYTRAAKSHQLRTPRSEHTHSYPAVGSNSLILVTTADSNLELQQSEMVVVSGFMFT